MSTDDGGTDVPDGFEPYVARSSFADPWQPLYRRSADGVVEIALLLDQRHTNSRGIAHGGLLFALADNAMGQACEVEHGAVSGVVTVHADVDFLAPARLGQWVRWHATVTPGTGSLRFASCVVAVGEETCARLSGVYRVLGSPSSRS